jgi:hypothetical protein
MEIDQRQKDVCPPGEAGQSGQEELILAGHGDLREQFRLPSNQRAAVRVSIAHQIYFRGNIFMPAAEIKAAWKALKARTPPEQLAAAYRAMNIRD